MVIAIAAAKELLPLAPLMGLQNKMVLMLYSFPHALAHDDSLLIPNSSIPQYNGIIVSYTFWIAVLVVAVFYAHFPVSEQAAPHPMAVHMGLAAKKLGNGSCIPTGTAPPHHNPQPVKKACEIQDL
jgi:hypothetical protein